MQRFHFFLRGQALRFFGPPPLSPLPLPAPADAGSTPDLYCRACLVLFARALGLFVRLYNMLPHGSLVSARYVESECVERRRSRGYTLRGVQLA